MALEMTARGAQKRVEFLNSPEIKELMPAINALGLHTMDTVYIKEIDGILIGNSTIVYYNAELPYIGGSLERAKKLGKRLAGFGIETELAKTGNEDSYLIFVDPLQDGFAKKVEYATQLPKLEAAITANRAAGLTANDPEIQSLNQRVATLRLGALGPKAAAVQPQGN